MSTFKNLEKIKKTLKKKKTSSNPDKNIICIRFKLLQKYFQSYVVYLFYSTITLK